MKTIEIKLYKFSELSDSAKQKAIDNFRNQDQVFTDHIWDDAHETIKEFHNIFPTSEGRNSWLDINTGSIDNDILQLSGIRLRTYLINNFYQGLFKRKYLGHSKALIGENCNTRPHRMKKFNTDYKGAVYCSYHSNIQYENTCTLTGVCYDMGLLDPIYNFLKNPSNIDFEELLTDCMDSLRKSIDSEIDYRNTDAAISEDIEANEYDFTENGELY